MFISADTRTGIKYCLPRIPIMVMNMKILRTIRSMIKHEARKFFDNRMERNKKRLRASGNSRKL
ncbi:hypothetical protein ABE24_19950 [Cytobacillus firmus]|nr:hypothetical protein [Cytobacillus firmus]